MSSVIAICNIALTNLGKSNINSLNEPTPEARACNQFFDHIRDTLLQSYPWRFATITASIAEMENDKPEEWLYSYARPADCLKVLSIGKTRRHAMASHSGVEALPYDVLGNRIYCDVSPAYLNYIFRQTDPAFFSPLFSEALSWHLAVRLAMPLTRDPKVRAEAFQLAMQTQAAAEMADANEVRHDYGHDAEYIGARN